MKSNLREVHPFLNQKFRTIYKDEIKSEIVFKELFPNEPIELYKLDAIWKYQGCNKRTNLKKLSNAKVQK
jgi:hypothetical protein